MTSTISSLGVGSGLPLDTLLSSLQDNENVALTAIQTKQASVQARISAYGQLKSVVTSLQSAAKDLSTSYDALQTSVGGDAFTASTTSQAIAGQYSITVNSLASAQTLVTQGQASQTDAIGSGGKITVTLADGSSQTLDLTGKDTSLKGLIKAINTTPELGIQATLVNDGSGTPYHLLLTATQTGTDASVSSISVDGNDGLQSLIGFTPDTPNAGLTEHAAANASLDINGIAISSQSNKVQDAILGVTLNLNSTTTTATSLSLTHDDSATIDAVQSFVSAYNTLQTTLQSLTAYDVTQQTGSPLTGDNVASSIQNQVRSAINVVASSGVIRNLSQLGITTDINDGTLAVDSDKLAAAVSDNLEDVQNLLAGTGGVADTLTKVTGNILSSSGVLATAVDSANRSSSDLQQQYDDTSARIATVMANYQKQFTNLDAMVAQMNSISTYLTQQLSMLSSQSSSSKSSS
jgi:flagellar hook-associated protein 2